MPLRSFQTSQKLSLFFIKTKKVKQKWLIFAKNGHMIIIQDIKSMEIEVYNSLSTASRFNKWISYSYVSKVRLTTTPYRYKGYLLFRVNHTKV